MPDLSSGSVLGWLIPVAVGFVVLAIAVAAIVWAVRRARRSPAARRAAAAALHGAGEHLAGLDDDVRQFDAELAVSGARDANAPTLVPRTRLTSGHVVDTGYAQYSLLADPARMPAEVRRGAAALERDVRSAREAVAAARREHERWVAASVPPARQRALVAAHLEAVMSDLGDPTALVAELSARFATTQWRSAARIAERVQAARHDATARLAAAVLPTTGLAPELVTLENVLRRIESDARIVEDLHRLTLQAGQAAPEEIAHARTALGQSHVIAEHSADGMAAEIVQMEQQLTAVEADAARAPVAVVDAVARLRSQLDDLVDARRSAQQTTRSARTSLAGTLAAVRAVIARAEGDDAAIAGVDTRAHLRSAQRHLASARQSTSPTEALSAARRGLQEADATLRQPADAGITEMTSDRD